MNKYTDRLSLRTLRLLNKAIILGGACSLLGAGLLSFQHGSGPASRMPWYFWALVLWFCLSILYTPPARLGIAPTEMQADIAWLLIAVAVFGLGLTLGMSIFLPLSSTSILLMCFVLALGVGGAKALLRKRQQSHHLPTPR
jgi:uncharacterized membrane protein YadS